MNSLISMLRESCRTVREVISVQLVMNCKYHPQEMNLYFLTLSQISGRTDTQKLERREESLKEMLAFLPGEANTLANHLLITFHVTNPSDKHKYELHVPIRSQA